MIDRLARYLMRWVMSTDQFEELMATIKIQRAIIDDQRVTIERLKLEATLLEELI